MWYKNVRAQNILILALSFIGLMGSVYVFNLNWELSTKERNQIEVEVFSSLVDYLTYHPKVEIDYLFIGTTGKDPSPEILNKFEDHISNVGPISSSRKSFGFSAPVVHKEDVNKRGIQINLESLERESNGDVNVRTVIYQDRAASATYVFTLSKYDGVYRVNHVSFPDRGIF
ncbi:hypothetical protein [Rhodohalobacter sulfatireducens]|uniref:Uncharacterized protein n=1 Tax=Rhodohalobacter sulfatireducens TaxID=2911366 RepID=A0ABS9KFT3_9BACT|nr:hypothetical protein [Rhodohalobacter sulfatireducens]MCG2589714.1 hypothetical protein [Rhodohalobacter sulfatireducens]MDR9364996.1 hypothetical protein [Balneolaceae bacterium]MDR9408428.1 hypothetical protein [Balneolaceae bacterium]